MEVFVPQLGKLAVESLGLRRRVGSGGRGKSF